MNRYCDRYLLKVGIIAKKTHDETLISLEPVINMNDGFFGHFSLLGIQHRSILVITLPLDVTIKLNCIEQINWVWQINSVPLPSINFRKFVTGDEK